MAQSFFMNRNINKGKLYLTTVYLWSPVMKQNGTTENKKYSNTHHETLKNEQRIKDFLKRKMKRKKLVKMVPIQLTAIQVLCEVKGDKSHFSLSVNK